MRPNLIVIASIVFVLAVNIALDKYTDIPMLIRWTLSAGLGLVVTLALTKFSERRQKLNTNNALDRP
ncbi:hypothetical protein [Paeniglutamicibacter cryotolerans]|uniref:Uncharacterized protein YebE (UPF0316 family) n=1 Tax=Paeniglutamicibacter cryotolerans TaxID=670079 RepID=A0A839QNY5_9MICC|nr:hypothetical protein [Paeniglutamicibacter cryotolerans]MBB2997313.1 uncharacterized protein YebE (UPF0316 family) [Paeniglutamicibacter cryotolerans]